MLETAKVCGTRNQRQLPVAFTGFDMAAFHLLLKQLPAVLQRMVDALRIDIFDTNGQFAFTGSHKRDASAH
ncbi:hypothetical protein D3C78_1698080 [compost metagenome]